MARHYKDWLSAYIEYAGYGEAPVYMTFWTGVSAIAGCLRRRVWIDQMYFKWFPNFYIVLVAPPGVVAKTSTVGIGMNLLRDVPGVNFGPDIVTWQALISAFVDSTDAFEYQAKFHEHSAITLESGEFGNLLDPRDKDMVDLMVALWDGKQGAMKKSTKGGGAESVINPWINLIACTTPAWIAQNFPEYMLGGGFTSRCIFVYADAKKQLVPYLSKVIPAGMEENRQKLIEDLIDISRGPVGEYKLTKTAFEWGEAWYNRHYSNRALNLEDDRFGGYIARKQTHVHKLAMVLAASTGNKMEITEEHLKLADTMITDLEPDMAMVFSKIGKSDNSFYTDRLLQFIQRKKEAKYSDAYKFVHTYFPLARDFEEVVAGLIRAGYIRLDKTKDTLVALL